MRWFAVAAAAEALAPSSIYVHLPFCRRRCFYCDFPVVVSGDGAATDARAAAYFAYLEKELATQPPGGALETVYFGGGTPSLVPPELLKRFIRRLDETRGVSRDAEVTLECDPGTFDAAKLGAFVGAGVTRVSLGVQSFDDSILEAAGRAHRRADVDDAVGFVKAAGLRHGWSLDLISGLPGLDRDGWRRTLERAAELDPPHISSYDLQVEAGTAFGKWYADDAAGHGSRPPLPADEAAADMYRDASRFWRDRGYAHYEISSFARSPADVARHNSAYWRPAPSWRALGLGATCSEDGRRFARPREMKEYEAWVDAGAIVEREPAGGDALLDEALTALRTSGGLDLGRVADVYGAERSEAARRGAQEAIGLGLAVVDDDVLRLTDPEGFLFSNFALAGIFAELGEEDGS